MKNPRLRAAMFEAVENQLKDNNPECTAKTLERLKEADYTEERAKEMIAAVLMEEMYEVLKFKRVFDEKSYCMKLNNLGINRQVDECVVVEDLEVNKIMPAVRDLYVGRNETCPCGSGKKYKKCCGR